MPEPTVRPYGGWPSPIDTDLLLSSAVGLGEVQVDGSAIWWSELRPSEGARVQLVRRSPGGDPEDMLPDGFSARTRVHEYGGGAWTVHEGVVFFTNWTDQRLYRSAPGGAPEPISEQAEPAALRYADHRVSPDGRWVLSVREDHRGAGEAVNGIVVVATDGSDEHVVVGGPDFVSFPRLSPDGRALAWTQWDHPRMPWDGTELWVAPFDPDTGTVADGWAVAGGPDESLFQPEWSPHGVLHVVSDRTDWWNLYRFSEPGAPEPGAALLAVIPIEAEIATPQWVFAMSRYAFVGNGQILFAYSQAGFDRVGVTVAGSDDGAFDQLDLPYTAVTSVRPGPRKDSVVCIAATPEAEPAIVVLDVHSGVETIRPPRDLGLDPSLLARPESVDFPTSGARTAHGLFYPPTNPESAPPDDERPPLLVLIHGGPTAAARPQLQLGVQFWTSRGFAVVDVNYGGSVGYGRPFREQLQEQWGVVDVDDCVAAARHLASEGRVDADRLAIRGGSAGGYTTLAALAFHDLFSAGMSQYGVADLSALAADTHKFESRYLDGLIGPWPEAEAIYRERSPINHTEGFDRPLLVLQGLDDEIVPPNQSEMIVDALRRRGVPVAYLAFEGEQHGFRQADTIRRAVEAELSFYAQVWGIELSDDIDPVEVENL
jgi:dipeptidyl aminopeptidase/acylaminoacyl peptidase